MLKFILVVLFLITLYVLWRWVAKQKINAAFEEQRQALSELVQNPQEEHDLPEKTKLIKQMIAEERQKAGLNPSKRGIKRYSSSRAAEFSRRPICTRQADH